MNRAGSPCELAGRRPFFYPGSARSSTLFPLFAYALKDCRPGRGLLVVRQNGKEVVSPRRPPGLACLPGSDHPRLLTRPKGAPTRLAAGSPVGSPAESAVRGKDAAELLNHPKFHAAGACRVRDARRAAFRGELR